MKRHLKTYGFVLLLLGWLHFTSMPFTGSFTPTINSIEYALEEQGIQDPVFYQLLATELTKSPRLSSIALTKRIQDVLHSVNNRYVSEQKWNRVIEINSNYLAFSIGKKSATSYVNTFPILMGLLSYGIGFLGAIFILIHPLYNPSTLKKITLGSFAFSLSNKGRNAIALTVYLLFFYSIIYLKPQYAINWTTPLDGLSNLLNGSAATHWFVLGFVFSSVMSIMAIRSFHKYKNNRYQKLRIGVALIAQWIFAFIGSELLLRFQMPHWDIKTPFPLAFDIILEENVNLLIQGGSLGNILLIWGVLLTVIGTPIMVYFYGKRWICSWLCGYGGLAATLGDPFKQHSSYSLISWKAERWILYSVLLFTITSTAATLYSYFTGIDSLLGLKTETLQWSYGFFIGAFFSGIIGVGFYPVLGSRIWCRFGCPLGAYMGIVQRFASRFRISVNNGQCISCGNCSVHCEMGIDVRSYAQRDQNIVRASCVGCGICEEVCPKGVLKLENGPSFYSNENFK